MEKTGHEQIENQFTARAIITGMLLGGILCLSNLYVAMKTGWSMGVSLTAAILAFVIFSSLSGMGLIKRKFGMMENNIMKSAASSAGYMTGGGTVAAIPALMMITGQPMDGTQMFFWIMSIAMLGLVMAIPMKQQMINIEQLRFPTGFATAETLKALYSTEAHTKAGTEQAKLLGLGGLISGIIALFKGIKAKWMPFNIPDTFPIWPGATLKGVPLDKFTISLEGSVMMVGAGAIMGWRAAWSMCLGALINFGILIPWVYSEGIIPKLTYKAMVGWSVWFGSAMVLTGGLLAFAFQWKTVARAMSSVTTAFRKKGGEVLDLAGEVPMSWFFIGLLIFSPIVVALEHWFFGIKIWMGALSVFMGFFIAIVASRATGETDTTPSGALGKVTQLTYGALDYGNMTTNLMTANVTCGMGLHAADLLTDLKCGYIIKADPRKQFWAQFFGVVAGSLFIVPAYRILFPSPEVLGTTAWPAPAAISWKAVADILAKGFTSLHPTARWAILVGGILGIVIVLMERYFPKIKKYIPSAMGFGIAFTSPACYSISMFIGALIAKIIEKRKAEYYDRFVVPVGSGFIAGESIVGVLIAILVVLKILDG